MAAVMMAWMCGVSAVNKGASGAIVTSSETWERRGFSFEDCGDSKISLRVYT